MNEAETFEEYQTRLRHAEDAHKIALERGKVQFEQISPYALAGMRAPALVSAGGIAAALGFYSANYDRLNVQEGALATFNSILFWLFLSLIATVVAPGFAYLSQMAYAASCSAEKYDYAHPYVHATQKSKVWEWVGNVMRYVATGVVVVSIICLGWGGYLFLSLVK